MKKQQLDHVLRAAGRITGEKQFIIIGSQALHGKYPDLVDEIVKSAEVDLFAARSPGRTEWLNAIGIYSQFHETFGYYADPVDEKTATLPKGWEGRLVNLPPGNTEGVKGLCLEPHDLAIAKYVASREQDLIFTRELVRRGLLSEERLRTLLDQTPVDEQGRVRILARIAQDFGEVRELDAGQERGERRKSSAAVADSGPFEEMEKIRARAREDWLKLRRQARGQSSASRSTRSRGLERDESAQKSVADFDDETSS